MSYAIAIDLGTTFVKGAVLDLEAMSLQHIIRLPIPDFLPGLPQGHKEILPEKLVSSVYQLVTELLDAAPKCEGLVMCSQMHTMVLVDAKGQARSNAISWMDQRLLSVDDQGSTFMETVRQRLTTEEMQQLGNEVRPGIPLGTLFWFAEKQMLSEPGLLPLSWPDYILTQIAQASPCTELTNAAAQGALNLGCGTWHKTIIEKLGLSSLQWPEICSHGTVVGEFSYKGQSIPCYTPVGDQQAALLGALLTFDELSLNISTGSQVSQLTKSYQPGSFQTRPFFDGSFLNTITHIPAGRSLNALIRLLTELGQVDADPWYAILKAVEDVPETDLQVSLSFYDGALGREGAITHIREGNLSVGSLFRAAFNSMALSYWQMAQKLDCQWQRLVFSGGLVRKSMPLQQAILAQFGCPHRLAHHEEDTLIGLMILAKSWMDGIKPVVSVLQQYEQLLS